MIELSNHLVVQRSEVTEQKDLTTFMNSIAGVGKKIRVVESFNQFFSVKNMFSCMDSGDVESLNMIVEKNSIKMTNEDWSLIKAYNELRAKLIEALKPKYNFTKVPEGCNLEQKVKINKTTISRSGYSISIKTAQKIWESASKYWFDEKERPETVIYDLSIGGYRRDIIVTPKNVQVGCQNVERWEFEQLALHMNWDIPS